MLEDCVLTILQLNWNQGFGDKRTKLNICHRMLTSSTHLQMKNVRTKRAKLQFFYCQICKFLGGFRCRRRRGCLRVSLTSFKLHPTTSNKSQHHGTTHNLVCKRSQQVGPNNVASCWPTMLRAFALPFKLPSVCKATRFKSVFFS